VSNPAERPAVASRRAWLCPAAVLRHRPPLFFCRHRVAPFRHSRCCFQGTHSAPGYLARGVPLSHPL